MIRTVRLKLLPLPSQSPILTETAQLFTAAYNEVCRIGWRNEETNGVRLHHLTYRNLKAAIPTLLSNLQIQARVRATETLRSTMARKRSGKLVSCPKSRRCHPRYGKDTHKIYWHQSLVRLTTTRGRISVPFKPNPHNSQRLLSGRALSSELVEKRSGWWIYVAIELAAPTILPTPVVIGVDLGITRPAVTSNSRFLGKRRWKDITHKIFKKRRQCQSKGTKSSKRRLRILRGKLARFRHDCDHVISKRIVETTGPGGTIVLENLTGIRSGAQTRSKKFNRWLHGWSFFRLKQFVAYKSEEMGIAVVGVDPRHTSQTCSRCGDRHRRNRKSQSLFRCRTCGYSLNADLNAARNVRQKYLASLGTSLACRSPSSDPTAHTG